MHSVIASERLVGSNAPATRSAAIVGHPVDDHDHDHDHDHDDDDDDDDVDDDDDARETIFSPTVTPRDLRA